MDKYRQIVKRRVTLGFIYCILVLVTQIIGRIFGEESYEVSFVSGFAFGIAGVALAKNIKYAKGLKNEELLRKMYIKEHDERLVQIAAKSGFWGMNITIYALCLAMLVALFFNKQTFYVLLVTCMSMIAIKLITWWYFNRKY